MSEEQLHEIPNRGHNRARSATSFVSFARRQRVGPTAAIATPKTCQQRQPPAGKGTRQLKLEITAGRRRSPATLPGYHRGRPPRNKGLRYPPDPPTVEEIIAVMRAAGDRPDGVRLRGVIIVLWRAGLRVSEALALAESDLDRVRGAIQVRHGKGGRRREVGMDRWAWEALDAWLTLRAGLPIGALFCVLRGPTRGRPCSAAGVRVQLRNAAIAAGVRRRLAPHQLRHAHAVEMLREGVPLVVIQRHSGMPTSGSRPCTCVASITPRSCTPSTNARRR